jgi:tetratricopeptide (TPR) repeat protein
MSEPEKQDNLVVKTHHEGKQTPLTKGDERMVALDPDGVTITRGLTNQFPDPHAPEAADLVQRIFRAHRDSDGPSTVEQAEAYRKKFGWNPRVEWLRILGLEILNADALIEEQEAFLKQLEGASAGNLPSNPTPLSAPCQDATWQWALGANYLNLMEWLWKAQRYQEALNIFEKTFAGLDPNGDTERRQERFIIKASCLFRLEREQEAEEALKRGRDLNEETFAQIWSIYSLRVPELKSILD